MIDVAKIIIIGLVGAFLAITVKEQKPEFALGISLVTGLIILIICLSPIYNVIEALKQICERTSIDIYFFTTILKIIGISYMTQLASQTAEDGGQKTIATKIDFAGKIAIIILSIPILQSIIDILLELVNL